MARVTKAILATSPNVVMLPTAAPRKVENNRFAAQREAKAALRQAQPWPGGRRMFPGESHARRTAETVCAMNKTPELFMLSAILSVLDADARERVRRMTSAYTYSDNEAERQGAAAIEAACPLNVGEQCNLSSAFDHVNGSR